MPQISRGRTRYDGQRRKVTPPHVSLGDLRALLGWTIDELIERVEELDMCAPPSKGTISGLERGHRGASEELLRAIEAAYGLRDGAITTDYRPRAAKVSAA